METLSIKALKKFQYSVNLKVTLIFKNQLCSKATASGNYSIYQDTVMCQMAKTVGETTKKVTYLLSLLEKLKNQSPHYMQDNTSASKKLEPSGHKGL